MIPTQYTAKAVSTKQIIYTRKPVEWVTSTGRGTGFYTEKTTGISTPVYNPSRYDPLVPRTRPRVSQMPTSYDFNANGDDGIPSKFTSPEFYTHRGGYEAPAPSVPSREQFVSEGGLFGEGATVASDEEIFEERAKEGFDWVSLLIVGLLFVAFIIVMAVF